MPRRAAKFSIPACCSSPPPSTTKQDPIYRHIITGSETADQDARIPSTTKITPYRQPHSSRGPRCDYPPVPPPEPCTRAARIACFRLWRPFPTTPQQPPNPQRSSITFLMIGRPTHLSRPPNDHHPRRTHHLATASWQPIHPSNSPTTSPRTPAGTHPSSPGWRCGARGATGSTRPSTSGARRARTGRGAAAAAPSGGRRCSRGGRARRCRPGCGCWPTRRRERRSGRASPPALPPGPGCVRFVFFFFR